MDFTREPIIETIITPKDGYKLVVRSSKGVTQEEYFLEAVQIVSYGNAFFYRSTELPKSFLVPVSDYELIETRETRVALKSATPDRAIKIGGGREASLRPVKEAPVRESTTREPLREGMRESAREPAYSKEFEKGESLEKATQAETPALASLPPAEARHDKKRDRRRATRRRRGDPLEVEGSEEMVVTDSAAEPAFASEKREFSTSLTSILPPPSQLISDTIHQYRGSELFKDIFHTPLEAEEAKQESKELAQQADQTPHLNPSQEPIASETSFLGSLFFKPPSALVHETLPAGTIESSTELFSLAKSHETPAVVQTHQQTQEMNDQKTFFLEVLSQSPKSIEEVKAEEGFAVSVKEAQEKPSMESSFMHHDKEHKQREEEKTGAAETSSSPSFWPDSFGKSHREKHGEEDHPLPL